MRKTEAMWNVRQAPDILKTQIRRWLRARKGFRINELPSVDLSIVQGDSPSRISLLMLGIGRPSAFGGVDTALRILEAVRPHFSRARIVVLAENEAEFDKSAWPDWDLGSERPDADRSIVFLGDGRQRLQVDVSDRFVATHWRTAYYVQELNRQLAASGIKVNPYVYLIQDFEPGFYPWSELYLLAEGTYRSNDNAIAVFNTKILRQYFENRGYRFGSEYDFEPRLNPKLALHRVRLAGHAKRRLMLVYGRPSQPRNAFDLIVEALRQWAQLYPGAKDWEALSLGETHRDIDVAHGLRLKSVGKVPLETYAAFLLDASVGLSLMASPHPSYPPLEMAEFGVQVVTNDFANKALAHRSRNITGLADIRPQTIAEALARNCETYDRGRIIIDHSPAFLGGDLEFPFVHELAAKLI